MNLNYCRIKYTYITSRNNIFKFSQKCKNDFLLENKG